MWPSPFYNRDLNVMSRSLLELRPSSKQRLKHPEGLVSIGSLTVKLRDQPHALIALNHVQSSDLWCSVFILCCCQSGQGRPRASALCSRMCRAPIQTSEVLSTSSACMPQLCRALALRLDRPPPPPLLWLPVCAGPKYRGTGKT